MTKRAIQLLRPPASGVLAVTVIAFDDSVSVGVASGSRWVLGKVRALAVLIGAAGL